MPETTPVSPLDLSSFDNLDSTRPGAGALATTPAGQQNALVTTDARLLPQVRPERLVEVANLNADDLAAARRSAAQIDFRKTTTLLGHGDNVLSGISQASRQLLTGVRLGDAGEVGRMH